MSGMLLERPTDLYVLRVTNGERLQVVLMNVAMGLSFRRVTGVAHVAKPFVHVPNMAVVYEGVARHIVQAVVAIKLQKLHVFLSDKRVWCFSVSFDAGTNHGDSIVDVWVRLCVRGLIKNFHLRAIPVQESHT